MTDSTVLVLTFSDQYDWGFSGKNGIFLNSSTDVDDTWYGSICQVFKSVIRYDVYKGANRAGIYSANREIIEIAQIYNPNYVFYPCNFSGIVTESTLLTLRKMGSIVIADFFDDDRYFDPFCKWLIPYLDYVVTHVSTLKNEYEKLGARAILSPCIPLNTSILKKLENTNKSYDATFVGSLYLYRRNFLADITAHGTKVIYLGGGNENKIHFSTMVSIFNKSRINLNLSSGQPGRSIIVGRVFEVPLCGGFLLTEYFPELERYFDIGREIECFKTPKEAAQKIQYYLNHSEELERIAARGYDRAHRDYAGPIVIKKVLNEIEEDLRRRGRPEIIGPVNGTNTLRKADAMQYFKWVRALLKSAPPLRNQWYETVKIVLSTDPEHKEATRLLIRAKKWGDPEPVLSHVRKITHKWRLFLLFISSKLSHLSFSSIIRHINAYKNMK